MPKRKKTTHRVTTHKPNGAIGQSSGTMEVAPQPPEVVTPSVEEALRFVQEIGEMNDRVERSHERYLEAQATAKERKGEWETQVLALQSRIKEATHPKPMPLFDAGQREADQRAMEQAAQAALPEEASLQTGCENGLHGALNDGDPRIGDSSVEVDEICSQCAGIVSIRSYTRTAWDREHPAES